MAICSIRKTNFSRGRNWHRIQMVQRLQCGGKKVQWHHARKHTRAHDHGTRGHRRARNLLRGDEVQVRDEARRNDVRIRAHIRVRDRIHVNSVRA